MRIDRADLLEACHQVMVEYPDSSGARPRQAPTHSRASLPSVSTCVRRFCLDCLGVSSGRGAFDCGSTVCLLRPASPFLGKPMPESFRGANCPGEPHSVLKCRPSRRLIHAQCRQCQPGNATDCTATECPLYPLRPWDGPGKAPKRRLSERELAQRRLAQSSPSFRARKTRGQKPSTAQEGAFDG